MDICDYVGQVFGDEARKKMLNIRKGGDNNDKGNKYEQFFSVDYIINILATAPNDAPYITVASQEMGFVDDFIVRDNKRNQKDNYQAKNSDGPPADWSEEMHDRFKKQQTIDTNFHGYKDASQTLLVSSKQKHENNSTKLKNLGVKAFKSEFFPFAPSSPELISISLQTRNSLEKLCGKKSLSTLDHGFKVMLGAWSSLSGEKAISDIFQIAIDMSNPNIFEKTHIEPPDWLTQKINSFNNIDIRVESTNFSVQCNGLEVNIYSELPEPSQSELSEITDELEFVVFLLALTQDDYKH